MRRIFLLLLIIFALLINGCSMFISSDVQNNAELNDIEVVVGEFGQKLQTVSLLSPDVEQEIKEVYTDYATSELIEKWISDPTKAPGRLVSSPWPDRIEIIKITEESPDLYKVEGEIIEITSVEKVSGGQAASIPVNMEVHRVGDHWLISKYEITN